MALKINKAEAPSVSTTMSALLGKKGVSEGVTLMDVSNATKALGLMQHAYSDVGDLEIEENVELSLDDMVDRLIALDKQVAKIMEDPRIKQLAELKKTVKEALEAEAGSLETSVSFQAAKGRIELSPSSKSRKITNKAALLLIMGEDQFVNLADFKLGDIDKYLSETEKEQVLTESQTGPRSMKIVHTEN